MATPEAALKLEIARLTGAINRHRSGGGQARPPSSTSRTTYVNPSYKPPSSKTYVHPEYQSSRATASTSSNSSSTVRPASASGTGPSLSQPHDVTINGVVFESSKRSLVRKDIIPSVNSKPPPSGPRPRVQFSRNRLDVGPRTRVYKPKAPSRSRLKLDNTRRAYQSQRNQGKKRYVDKPCPRFTTTGSCNRGLTCAYKHDPAKIAICWPYLQNNCPHTAETCALSHDSNPHRTPLCVHFANAGRCTRANCPYPHVHVGRREGVCRDFAVLGYCEAGIDCSKQHVRECPDFAESGECPNKFCKLPHVIRANRARKAVSAPVPAATTAVSAPATDDLVSDVTTPALTVQDSQLGDEYISLTFNESEDEESSDDDDEEEGDSPSLGDEEAAQD
ncbi:hypothetical protein F5148DRAFT_1171171 [Russula earlei]|uniref:Uncharacterized protein n=1 Tax=Russula earlei TaxID=71964 RepID=A0ACC0UIK3_9AGAM|nr:hypothetical protein F5148DRAFT_1171171 [Russula earlei]